jgi:hypothetical protein
MFWLTTLLGLIPNIVLGIERIHGDAKKGADKKTLAMEALKVAITGASGVLPADIPLINAAGSLVSSVIDGTVALFNKTGWPAGTPNSKRFTIKVG